MYTWHTPSAWPSWATTRPPVDAALALLRIGLTALVGYLAVVVLLGAMADVARWRPLLQASRLLTPPAGLGLLPGVLRRQLIEEGRAEEAELRLDDLTDGFFIGNALRGLMPARLA